MKENQPIQGEIAEARKKLPALLKFRAAYPWRPFEVVKRPPAPKVKNTAWVRNPVDAFIAAGQEERGLTPRPEANKHVLLRRVYLDLIGLPPTPEEIDAYVQDKSADAYEKVVERLLMSSRYGERGGHPQGGVKGYGEKIAEIWKFDPTTMKWEHKEPNRSPSPPACCAAQQVFDTAQNRFLRNRSASGNPARGAAPKIWELMRAELVPNDVCVAALRKIEKGAPR